MRQAGGMEAGRAYEAGGGDGGRQRVRGRQ
jgi:hypothetical protein